MCSPLRRTSFLAMACLLTGLLLIAPPNANAQNISGAIFTTFADGTTVNGNHFPSKDVVYLNGGPQNTHSNGLPPGTYYFQVTNPNGNVLLSTDDITCRQVVVAPVIPGGEGIFQGAPAGPAPISCTSSDNGLGNFHANGAVNPANGGSIPIQLCAQSGCPAGQPDYNDTPNNGGEYKVWLTLVTDYDPVNCAANHGFCNKKSKTDNFKVRANEALVKVCKFNDQNDDGAQNNGEPFIAHWPIIATGVIGDTGSGVEAQTDDNGCVAFAVDTFLNGNGTATVTLTETIPTGWSQTAPLDGPCTLTGKATTPPDACSVSGGVITVTLSPKDSVNVPNFGNFQNGTGLSPLTVTKDANPSLTRTFKWTITKAVASVSNCTVGGNPDFCTSGAETIDYTTTVKSDSGTDSGWQVTGTITVGNVNSTDISGVTVDDAVTNNGSCTVDTAAFYGAGSSGTVPANGHVDLSYSCTYSSAPSPAAGSNTATAHYMLNGKATDSSNIPATSFDFSQATITGVDTTVTVTDTLFAAANSGEALGTVSIDPDTLKITTTPNAPATSSGDGIFNYSLAFTDTAGTCTTHNNTATFTTNDSGTSGSDNKSATVCVGADLTTSKTLTPSSSSNVSKSSNQGSQVNTSGSVTLNYTVTETATWGLSGTILVNNPNDWESVKASVSELPTGANNCTLTPNGSQAVPPSGSASWNYTCSPTAASGSNTAVASWSGAFTPDTSATSNSPTFNFPTITVTDIFEGSNLKTLGTLTAPSTSATFPDSYTVTPPAGTCTTFHNIASDGTNQSSAAVKVCVGADLTVTKTAASSMNTAITKKSNQPSPDDVGGSTTLSYTIQVTESGWNVQGSITVANPNDWESITATISDPIVAGWGGSCLLSSPFGPYAIAANNSKGITYNCNLTSAQVKALITGLNANTNTATATWTGAFTPDTTKSGTATFGFQALTVTDSFNGTNPPKTLGTVAPGTASTTFTDSYPVTVTAGKCMTFPNVATITQTGQSANASVTVCNTQTGALTMGFWKNNNGQGIITKYCGGTGGLTLVQFLAGNGTTWPGFNPFKDDTATTCAKEATYVSNIISGATCSSAGNTCNSMLRAQMLATALDVYFSDPTLGGNQIGAFNNLGNKTPALGGLAIDLSKICNGGDGGFGGSCPEDARRVFGICTGTNTPVAGCTAGVLGTTVLNMLLYSDFASSINGNPVATPNTGTTWYNQIKGLQVLAKDAFDSINNQIAPIAPSGVGTPSF